MRDNGLTRRSVLSGAAALLGGAAAGTTIPTAVAEPGTATAVPPGPVVRPGDPRYPDLMTGNNQRFVARPEYVKLITSTADAENAVRDAVRAGKRVSVRGGGHCFSDFVCNPEIEVILDVSAMTDVYYDERMRAFCVQSGARLTNVYEALYKGWHVTIPGGVCWSVGIAGHVAGGGYGLLSRAHGLTVDHLYAVEVVTVDERGGVRTVVATREADDPNRDLWWGHTGAGGGNFGVITRYWFRSPDAHDTDPADQLVSPPSTVLVSAVEFDWDELDQASFTRLVQNFGTWHERNADPGAATTAVSSLFNVSHRAHGSMGMFTQVDATAPNARRMLDDYLAAITEGVAARPRPAKAPIGELGKLPIDLGEPRELPWLQAARLVGTNNPTITDPTSRGVHKSAYLRKAFDDEQCAALYRGMTGEDFTNPDTMLVLLSFGGRVNAPERGATAHAQRDSAFKMCLQTFWNSAEDDDFHITWARETYRGMFAATGGVPVPGDHADGCYINYPDNDVAAPEFNRSGVPWQALYYRENYPRLQQVKKRWDPADHFRHALSIQPAR
ncbi:FAD-linked oxidase [Saccharothrix sp. ALI-22-I]|uniref:FAD-binding oxidoreductase n=1 Tax=Saccharothrix sp. ALI-22-I TaxID=1933778 RepID=UPI00097C50A4|nr:FAD-binding oxidoreductase [Saccharothrix sp. ALI-22-I]ONI92107.1 FAD-linked oxidase [Saccharothrix sp. ALI-22-I]